jgi:hypothetical protein
MCSDTNCWGFRLPHARIGGVLIVAQRRVKYTETMFYVVRQNRLHPRESPYYQRYIEKGLQQIHGGGSLNSQLTLVLLQLLQWQQPLQLSLSLHSLAHTHVLTLFNPLNLLSTRHASL